MTEYSVKSTATVLSVLSVVALMAVCLAPCIDAEGSGEEPTYDGDLGQFWSYSVQFVFNGNSAQSISWDFGDGTEPSIEWNPQHTYAEKGTYYVTQTVTNTSGTASSVYKVEIMGFPYIAFESNGGSAVETIQMSNGPSTATAAEKPADPTKEGSTFTGWYTDVDCKTAYDWSSKVVEGITLYAGWAVNAHTVSFSDGVDSQTVEDGGVAVEPTEPTKTGYTFDGWYNGDVLYVFSTPVTSDLTLTAKWNAITYTVTFSDGIESQTVSYGELVTEPTAPVKEGFTFGGWYNGDALYAFSTPVSSDLALTAKWTQITYTVTFDSVGGSSVESQTVAHGQTATEPTAPVKEGFIFDGWFVEGSKYDFSSPIMADMTLTAQWHEDNVPVEPVGPGDDGKDSDEKSKELAKVLTYMIVAIGGFGLVAAFVFVIWRF